MANAETVQALRGPFQRRDRRSASAFASAAIDMRADLADQLRLFMGWHRAIDVFSDQFLFHGRERWRRQFHENLVKDGGHQT